MRFRNKLIIIFITIKLIRSLSANLLYPPSENIAIYKPLFVHPTGTTCGLELKDTLCDNRLVNTPCSNASNLFFCDESCPYGNSLENLNYLDQIKLENMNPCSIIKDFANVLSKTNTTFSYYFDRNNNLCSNFERTINLKPFSLETTRISPVLSFFNSRTTAYPILNTGFTFTIWFRQFRSNNGYPIHN